RVLRRAGPARSAVGLPRRWPVSTHVRRRQRGRSRPLPPAAGHGLRTARGPPRRLDGTRVSELSGWARTEAPDLGEPALTRTPLGGAGTGKGFVSRPPGLRPLGLRPPGHPRSECWYRPGLIPTSEVNAVVNEPGFAHPHSAAVS